MIQAFHNKPLFRIVWPLVFGVFAYLLILLFNNSLGDLTSSFFSQELLFTILLTYFVFETSRAAILLIGKRSFSSAISKITTTLLAAVASSLLIVTLMVVLYFQVILSYSSFGTFSTEWQMFIIIYLSSSLIYAILVVANEYLFEENKEMIKFERDQAANLELELVKYQNEVNPELFYDSLESLISLIHKDPLEAEDYIDKLAMVYRHILSNKNAELTQFEEEWKNTLNVVSLLNEKHSNLITISNNLDNTDTLVIPGSISRIVEAVIRTTIISPSLPLSILVEDESSEYLVIRYKLNEHLRGASDLDLGDIQRAYSIFDKPVVTVKAYGEHYVKIPKLKMEAASA